MTRKLPPLAISYLTAPELPPPALPAVIAAIRAALQRTGTSVFVVDLTI